MKKNSKEWGLKLKKIVLQATLELKKEIGDEPSTKKRISIDSYRELIDDWKDKPLTEKVSLDDIIESLSLEVDKDLTEINTYIKNKVQNEYKKGE